MLLTAEKGGNVSMLKQNKFSHLLYPSILTNIIFNEVEVKYMLAFGRNAS